MRRPKRGPLEGMIGAALLNGICCTVGPYINDDWQPQTKTAVAGVEQASSKVRYGGNFSNDEKELICQAIADVEQKLPRAFDKITLTIVKSEQLPESLLAKAESNCPEAQLLFKEGKISYEEFERRLREPNIDFDGDYLLIHNEKKFGAIVREQLGSVSDEEVKEQYRRTVIHELGHLLVNNDRSFGRALEDQFKAIDEENNEDKERHVSDYGNWTEKQKERHNTWQQFYYELADVIQVYNDKKIAEGEASEARKAVEEIHTRFERTNTLGPKIREYRRRMGGIESEQGQDKFFDDYRRRVLPSELHAARERARSFVDKYDPDDFLNKLGSIFYCQPAEDIAETFLEWVAGDTDNKSTSVQKKLNLLNERLGTAYK